ncbi:hypothetical protein ABW20_dc0102463 [Dactylellina cionopaga]|nr:hypothetical protein ABW20_dc0102463 [Dactylellina cionopaga]
MRFFRNGCRNHNLDSGKTPSRDISVLFTPVTPKTPFSDRFTIRRSSQKSLLLLSFSTYHLDQYDQTQITASKGEILGHAMYLARLAVILDRAKVYTGAARAYYDGCYLLASVEPMLGSVERDITNEITMSVSA